MGDFSSHGSLREMVDSFNKMQKPPVKTIYALEQILAAGFAGTQSNVHVLTSSLKWSGTTTSHFDGETWEGTIEYGGPSVGINNPVIYAFYEQQRGGQHDFMLSAYAAGDQMDLVVDKMLDGDV